MPKHKGDWIRTFTGKNFYPFDPDKKEIDILDIAHALSNLCRFTGHVRSFYSVAQHSILVSELVWNWTSDMALTFCALLHDAPEAYLQDISRPVKRSVIMSEYVKAENELQNEIFEKFVGSIPSDKEYAVIKEADNVLLYTEGRDLMVGGTKGWHDADNITPLRTIIESWLPEKSEKEFLTLFNSYYKPF